MEKKKTSVYRLHDTIYRKLWRYRQKTTKANFRASLVAQLVKNSPAMQETPVWSLNWEDPPPTLVFLGFSGGSNGKESTWKVGELSSIPGLGRSPGEGKGYLLQYSCLENSMDRGASWAIVHGVTKSQAWLSEVECKIV